MIAAQGADLKKFEQKLALDSTAPMVLELTADRSGFVSRCDARIIGEVIRDVGGGRLTRESSINYDVGLDRIAKPGEAVKKSAALCRIHIANPAQGKVALARLRTAFAISHRKIRIAPLAHGIIA